MSLGDPDGSQSRTGVSLCHYAAEVVWSSGIRMPLGGDARVNKWSVISFLGARCGPKCHNILENYG